MLLSLLILHIFQIPYPKEIVVQRATLDLVLPNPVKTRAIASAKIKTDKLDAAKLIYLICYGAYTTQTLTGFDTRESNLCKANCNLKWNSFAQKELQTNQAM